ncbi:hypothetical protein RRG08_050277 [Elysia crispata]|uniref:Uncharacterized protein n=1 Tax=Elysia crispata TaxID=231223 RepID=A0AAE1EAJ5_9GAST|nr:hypothetical protein RRG08_050277 [Elysia crispata]
MEPRGLKWISLMTHGANSGKPQTVINCSMSNFRGHNSSPLKMLPTVSLGPQAAGGRFVQHSSNSSSEVQPAPKTTLRHDLEGHVD